MDNQIINDWKIKTGRQTLFYHKKCDLTFDCFHRSKITIILSNIFSNNTGKSVNEWNQSLRSQYCAKRNEVASAKKVICLRSPQPRFRSFLMSKIVNPHLTSILPLFYTESETIVRFFCTDKSGINFSKSLNSLFRIESFPELKAHLSDAIYLSPIFATLNAHRKAQILKFFEFIFSEYLVLDIKKVIERLFSIVDKSPFLDPHLMSQSFMSTYSINDYDYILSVDNIEFFSSQYKQITGFDFKHGEANKSQKNTIYDYKDVNASGANIKDLQNLLKEKFTPSLESIFTPHISWKHFNLYENDYLNASKAKTNTEQNLLAEQDSLNKADK